MLYAYLSHAPDFDAGILYDTAHLQVGSACHKSGSYGLCSVLKPL